MPSKLTLMIDEIIKFNSEFVASKGYERFATSKYPDKKIAIVACMDTRLVELLPAALGWSSGTPGAECRVGTRSTC